MDGDFVSQSDANFGRAPGRLQSFAWRPLSVSTATHAGRPPHTAWLPRPGCCRVDATHQPASCSSTIASVPVGHPIAGVYINDGATVIVLRLCLDS